MQSTDVCVAGQKLVGHKRRKYAAYGMGRTGSPKPDLACRSFCSCRDHVGERCPQAPLCTNPPAREKAAAKYFFGGRPEQTKKRTGNSKIPQHESENIAGLLLPAILTYCESEEEQRGSAKRQAARDAAKADKDGSGETVA